MDTFLSFLRIILSWPVVVFFLALIFRHEIRKLLGRLKKAYGLEWGEASIDKEPVDKSKAKDVLVHTKALETSKVTIKWKRVANLYWIGHDLMWTVDMLLRGAPRTSIIHGLKQSLHHLNELGFTDDPFASKLSILKTEAEYSRNDEWDSLRRNKYADELIRIRDYIGKLVSEHQSNFKPKST